MRKTTYIVRIECLSIGRVLEQQSLESKYFAGSSLGGGGEHIDLEVIDVIVTYDFFQDCIELVQDLDPCIQVGARPSPSVNLTQHFMQIIIGGFE